MAMNLGVPFKLLKEYKGKKIKVEASCGETYKGILLDAEENLSISLGEVMARLVDGRIVEMKAVYIRSYRVRFIRLPKSAAEYLPKLTRPPMRPKNVSFRGLGRGIGRGSFGNRPSYERRH